MEGEWDFDLGDWSETESVSTRQKLVKDMAMKIYTKNLDLHLLKAKQLSDICSRPMKNEQWRIITEKQFNAFNLILDLIKDGEIDELLCAIYRINEPTVDAIINLIDAGKIKSSHFVISNFFNQTKKPEKWAKKLKDFCDNNKSCHHAYVHNHSKVICLKRGNDHYVFEGSGNMSDNARIEQYVYENNEQVYNFHAEWIKQLTK